MRLLPSRQQRTAGYGVGGTSSLEWAGDKAIPGLQPAAKVAPVSPAAPAAPAAPAPITGGDQDYDDGFGPLPSPEKSGVSNPADSLQPLGVTQSPRAQSRTFSDQSTDAEDAAHGVKGPVPKVWARAQEVVAPFYDPADPASVLTCQNDVFSQAREEWFVGVPNTRIFPHSAICQLSMVDAAGNGYGGTGFYIGPNRILTCAHNLHDMTSVTIIPGKNSSDEPFGRCTLDASSWRVSNRYPTDGSDYDLAVIDSVPIAAPGGQWFGFLNQTPSGRLPIVVCGYSAQSDAVPELTQAIDGDMQHLHGGYVAQQSNIEVMEYPILTLHGASGSPVYHIRGSGTELRALVCGVHVSGEPAAHGLNRACFITPDKINWIEGRTSALSLGVVRALATERHETHFPPVRTLSSAEQRIALGALALLSPPVTALISSARAATSAYNVSIGIGPAASAGLLVGAGVSAGLVFTPGGGVGIYGQYDIRAGLIDSASLELQFTIVKGGFESFRGINWAVAVDVDLGISVSAQALFDASMNFQGATFGLGVGVGVEPIQVFLSLQQSYVKELSR